MPSFYFDSCLPTTSFTFLLLRMRYWENGCEKRDLIQSVPNSFSHADSLLDWNSHEKGPSIKIKDNGLSNLKYNGSLLLFFEVELYSCKMQLGKRRVSLIDDQAQMTKGWAILIVIP